MELGNQDLVFILNLAICLSILATGVLAVVLESPLGAVVAAGSTSLLASITYIFLAAPDVAMTEASIGSGLATIIFLYAIRRTSDKREEP